MTEQELTKKIIKNAEKQAAALIAAAQQQAESKLATAQIDAENRQTAALAQAEKDLATAKAQQAKAQEVTTIKARINARQDLIDQAFNTAREHWLKAPATEIKALVQALVTKYAKPQDKITIAKAWNHALPEYPVTTEITGGLIIENAIYRIELSLDVILNEVREKIAADVAQMLGVL